MTRRPGESRDLGTRRLGGAAIREQVEMAVPVRMAILDALTRDRH